MTSSAQSNVSSGQRLTAELETIAQRFLDALSGMRISSLSLHDEHADVLWLTESVLGPDEHEAVRSSLEIFAGEGAPLRHEYDLGDGRVAVTLRAGHGSGSVVGVVMAIVDHKTAMSQNLALAAARSGALQQPLAEFAKWLSDDVSATQLRLRALPELMADAALPMDLQLEAEPEAPQIAPAAVPAAKAPESRTAASAQNSGLPVNPMLERHYAALRAQPLVLYAQRLEPMATGSRIRRFEILLRSASEHGRDQAPKAMLEAAARNGLGSVVDRRVITELLVWLSRHADVWRTDPIAVSVNLSPTTLTEPHFFKFLELCLAKADLPRGMIAFEVDTALCAQNIERTAKASQLLAALGCTLVLDDFVLRGESIDLLGLKGLRMLKLHPDATTNIGLDKRRQAIVAGIAQMACVLGMHTCAKAIEMQQDRRWLAALKVDFAQGYGFARPEPLAQLAGAIAP